MWPRSGPIDLARSRHHHAQNVNQARLASLSQTGTSTLATSFALSSCLTAMSAPPIRVLITNDDGPPAKDSPYVLGLYLELKKLGMLYYRLNELIETQCFISYRLGCSCGTTCIAEILDRWACSYGSTAVTKLTVNLTIAYRKSCKWATQPHMWRVLIATNLSMLFMMSFMVNTSTPKKVILLCYALKLN